MIPLQKCYNISHEPTTNCFDVAHQHFTVLSMQRAYVTASSLQYVMICLRHTEFILIKNAWKT